MQAAATIWLEGLDDAQRAAALRPFAASERRRFTYLPRPRPGICLADLTRPQRKAAHRLLATALSVTAYAQAMTIMGLEEVLDRQEAWRRGRHSNDFWLVIFGEPHHSGGSRPWTWRWEGHHLSVTVTVDQYGDVHAAPIFLGANPATVARGSYPVLRPLGYEEDLARALLEHIGPAGRRLAIVADTAPADIRASTNPRVDALIRPLGISTDDVDAAGRQLFEQLLRIYLGRLSDSLDAAEYQRIQDAGGLLHFAWEGPQERGRGHYYRIQGPDLLIEYDNTANNANHAHTAYRRPGHDFGGVNVIADHHAIDHAVTQHSPAEPAPTRDP